MIALLLFAALLQPKPLEDKWPGVPDGFSEEERAAVAAYVQTGKRTLGIAEEELEATVKSLKKKIPTSGDGRKERLAQIKEAERALKLFKAGVKFHPARLSAVDFRKGDVARLDHRIKVTQVFGTDVEFRSGDNQYFVIQGLATDDLADGDSASVSFVLECVGTRQYKTALGGTRSLYTFRRFYHMDKVNEWEAVRIAEWEKKTTKK